MPRIIRKLLGTWGDVDEDDGNVLSVSGLFGKMEFTIVLKGRDGFRRNSLELPINLSLLLFSLPDLSLDRCNLGFQRCLLTRSVFALENRAGISVNEKANR